MNAMGRCNKPSNIKNTTSIKKVSVIQKKTTHEHSLPSFKHSNVNSNNLEVLTKTVKDEDGSIENHDERSQNSVLSSSNVDSHNKVKNSHSENSLVIPVNIVTSGLGLSEQDYVKKICSELNFSFNDEISDSTTHLIVKKNSNNKCKRTFKYMYALIKRLWIVSIQWLDLCMEIGQIFPEKFFVIKGDTSFQGSHSIVNFAKESGPYIFADYMFHYISTDNSTFMSQDQIHSLLVACGAKVYNGIENLKGPKNNQLILTNALINQQRKEAIQELYKKHKVPIVHAEWILECVCNYSVKPFGRYLLSNFF